MTTSRPSLSRLFLIHQAIAAREYPSLEDLAELCGVTARTIKRDLRMLRDAFRAPLTYFRAHNGYAYATPFNLSAPPLSEGELLALCFTITMAAAMGQTPFAPALRRSAEKLRAMLPEPYQAVLLDDGPCMSALADPAPPPRVETSIYFHDLLQAIERHRQARMTYYTMARDAVTTRVVDPYHLYFRRGMWYVHAWCHLRGETRDFALERIRRLELLAEHFTPPDHQAMLDRLARRFSLMNEGHAAVAIRFDAEWARRIRE
ncbi:MAG TPA: WYL domain-containing protein, partial [Armatimonadota bacterium]|nr:WYL domain-containing protein [Armatimonadota bacterium]